MITNKKVLMKRGFQKKCPSCGKFPLFKKFLKTYKKCKSCGINLSSYRSDDGPAYVTILIVGHIVIPLLLLTEKELKPSMVFQMTFWPILTVVLSLWLLPKIKGAFIGFQIGVNNKT